MPDWQPQETSSKDLLAEVGRLAAQSRAVLLEMVHAAGSGHLGSSLSCIDILAVLRFGHLRRFPGRDPVANDVFVLSKGHAAPAWYATLVVGGDLPRNEMVSLRRIDSRLQGHPDRRRLDLVDASTGALGQGLSIAIGRAEGKRFRGSPARCFCLLGDGELQEGQVWEAAMYAGSRGVGNVIALVDHNGSQADGPLAEVLPAPRLAEKFEAFGWHVQTVDGHSHDAVDRAMTAAKAGIGWPSVIIARTRKGFLGGERTVLDGSHSGSLTAEQTAEALRFLADLA